MGVFAGCAAEQAAPRVNPAALEKALVSLSVLSKHAGELELSAEQRNAIAGLIGEQRPVLDALNAEIRRLEGGLSSDLQADGTTDFAILERAERLVAAEGRAKVAHLRLWLAVHKVLSPEQRVALGRLEE